MNAATPFSLEALHAEYEAKPYEAALPTCLPKWLLYRLARELRLIELELGQKEAPVGVANISIVLFLLLKIVLGRADELGLSERCAVAEKDLMDLFGLYQACIEREVVRRALAIEDLSGDTALVAGVDDVLGALEQSNA